MSRVPAHPSCAPRERRGPRAPRMSAAGQPARRRERGAVLIIVAIMLILLFAFGALAVDGSHAWQVSSQCQATSDSAALAAARMLPDQAAAKREAISYGQKNMAPAVHGNVITAGDVEFGAWNFTTRVFTPTTAMTAVNAVRVKAGRSAANSNALPLTVAKAIGFGSTDVSAHSIAAFTSGKPWNLVLLQDVTNSFTAELAQAKQADHNLLDCFASNAPASSLFGIVTFTGWSKVMNGLVPIGTGYSALNTAVNGIKSCGSTGAPVCSGTDIAAGLEAAVNTLLASPPAEGVSQAIVLVSDGQPEPDKNGSHPTSTATQLRTLATQWADKADVAKISLFVVYYDGDKNPSAKSFMQTLVRGNGVFLSTPDPTKIPSLLTTICSKLASLKLVD